MKPYAQKKIVFLLACVIRNNTIGELQVSERPGLSNGTLAFGNEIFP